MILATLLMVSTALTTRTPSVSYYTTRLEDPKAIYLAAVADSQADDTNAIQEAIDRVQETTGQGILFIPSGIYRLTKTLTVWPGIRLIGYGPTRPVFRLAPDTPGFQTTEKFMVFFAGRRPDGPTPQPVVPETEGLRGGDFDLPNEANPGTFYSAMSNIDIHIDAGNPAAVGVRGRYAQHCYLAHIDFVLSSGLAGIHDTGNFSQDLRFFGGEYGIITRTPSPGWQFTLIDGYFEGQTRSAIKTRVTGLTLVRPHFSGVPRAIEVDKGYSEQLWVEGGLFENIKGPALTIYREANPRTQINLEGCYCYDVPVFAEFPETGRKVKLPDLSAALKQFTQGLQYENIGSRPRDWNNYAGTWIESELLDHELPPHPTPIRPKQAPVPPTETWANVTIFGAKGDGVTDDTDAIRKALAKSKVVYFPSGHYRVTDTIRLGLETVLVGLNPYTTRIQINDATPGFGAGPPAQGYRRGPTPFPGSPKPLIEAPAKGANVLSGIGLDTGGNNPSAVAAKWMAGADSLIDDVKFLGGHGSGVPVYNNTNSGDPNRERKWDSQYPSLWVTEGGGGTFQNIWTASTFAEAGMMVSDTTTPGRVYQLSSEHHVRHEVVVRNASHWRIVALQTEEERGESSAALPLEIHGSRDITVANLNMYRVVSVFQPYPYAVGVSDSKDIRFRNVHCYSNSKASFDNLILDQDHGIALRQREFAALTLNGGAPAPAKPVNPPTLAEEAKLEKLATGFYNISGGAVHPNGDFYFVDAKLHQILKWSFAQHGLSLVRDDPLYPTNLAFDKSGDLMVVSYAGRGIVYSFKPGSPNVSVIKPESSRRDSGITAMLPVSDWLLNSAIVDGQPLAYPYRFVSPDRSTFLPVGQDFIDGTLTWGVKLQPEIRSFGLAKVVPGRPFYVTGESEMRTYAVDVQPDGSIAHPRLFAEQGGEGVAEDKQGNVYIAAGEIYVYDPKGRIIGEIDVPERPTQLVFGGPDGKTLFITARTSLYSIRTR